MKTTILLSLCGIVLIAVILDILLVRPISTPTQTVDLHIATFRGIDAPKTVKIDGDTIVGFSCLDVSGVVVCYIASKVDKQARSGD